MIVLLALPGCDPAFELRGRVTSTDGKGLAQAEALVSCNGEAYVHTLSSADGRFFAPRIGGCSNDCEVVVRALGYEPYRAPVRSHCTKPGGASTMCATVKLEVKLPRTVP